jgi:hypothetical protein
VIKLLWILCSVFVFVYTFRECVKEELKVRGRVSGDLLMLLTLISFLIAVLGPLTIVAFFLYNGFKAIARVINEGYENKRSAI